jgi:probable DNA repair protein
MDSRSDSPLPNTVDLAGMLASLDTVSLVLTVNKRLAGYLHGRYADLQQQPVWETPQILSFNAWLLSLHEQLVTTGVEQRRLLSPNQETLLWEQIADDWNNSATVDNRLLRPSSAASSAADAWRLMYDWRIDRQQIVDYPSRESSLLAGWIERFDELCENNGWLPATLLGEIVRQHIDNGSIAIPERLFLAGFDELTPLQSELLESLANAGCDIAELHTQQDGTDVGVVGCHDNREEIRRAAAWARDRLLADPDSRIGIVVTQLNRLRSDIDRCFNATLHPEQQVQACDGVSEVFNISLGTPLANEPMVQDALLFLGLLVHGRIPLHRIGQLLRSRFLGDYETEWSCRALLDQRLREGEPPEIPLGRLLRALESGAGKPTACCKGLHDRLENAIARLQEAEEERQPDWPAIIASLLETAGWPGQRGLNSREYQCREHVIAVLEELGSLDPLEKTAGYTETLHRLNRLLQQSLFQPQGAGETPIQVVGPLEAAGHAFDALWIMNMDDENWPSKAEPNPLIPVPIQRAAGLPHASAERETRFAEAVTRRLLQSAPEVIFSYPKMDAERELRPSPLIGGYPAAESAPPGKSFSQAALCTADLENVPDGNAPPVTPESIPGGGTRLIGDQAACPFRAFANHRLGTSKLEEAELGFDARARGTLLHRCLEGFWRAVGDSETLHVMSTAKRGELIADCVERVFEKNWRDTGLETAYLGLEKSRVTLLMTRWIEKIELQRAAFRVVGTETEIELALEGLPLRLRADRIDELEDGRRIVIDYKSGKNFRPDWETERLQEPQLPLYTLAGEAKTAGALLAFINGKEIKLNGLVEEKGLLPVHYKAVYKGDWEALLADWKTWLHKLAGEVMQGRADIDPVDPKKSCKYCDLKPLCRIEEILGGLALEDENGE